MLELEFLGGFDRPGRGQTDAGPGLDLFPYLLRGILCDRRRPDELRAKLEHFILHGDLVGVVQPPPDASADHLAGFLPEVACSHVLGVVLDQFFAEPHGALIFAPGEFAVGFLEECNLGPLDAFPVHASGHVGRAVGLFQAFARQGGVGLGLGGFGPLDQVVQLLLVGQNVAVAAEKLRDAVGVAEMFQGLFVILGLHGDPALAACEPHLNFGLLHAYILEANQAATVSAEAGFAEKFLDVAPELQGLRMSGCVLECLGGVFQGGVEVPLAELGAGERVVRFGLGPLLLLHDVLDAHYLIKIPFGLLLVFLLELLASAGLGQPLFHYLHLGVHACVKPLEARLLFG